MPYLSMYVKVAKCRPRLLCVQDQRYLSYIFKLNNVMCILLIQANLAGRGYRS